MDGYREYSPNTVTRILIDTGLWSKPDQSSKTTGRFSKLVVKRAEKPAQTLNVDWSEVPENHYPSQKLPAVSGSSGRDVIEKTDEESESQIQDKCLIITNKTILMP